MFGECCGGIWGAGVSLGAGEGNGKLLVEEKGVLGSLR